MTCPVPYSRLEGALTTAARLGAREMALLDAQGIPMVSVGPPAARAGAGNAATPTLVAEAPVLLRGAIVATVRASGTAGATESLEALQDAARVAAGWASDLWSEASDVDSLAAEIVHAYEELHLLYELGESLASQMDVRAATTFVLEKIVTALHASWAELRPARGAARRVTAPAAREAAAAEVAAGRAGEPNPHEEASDLGAGVHCLSTTLRNGGRILGSIMVGRDTGDEPFTSMESKLLDAVGTLAASAIRNAQLHERARRQADTLRQREAYLRAVMDNVADGIITFDERGTIRSSNPAADEIFGFRPGEAAGKRALGLVDEATALLWLQGTPADAGAGGTEGTEGSGWPGWTQGGSHRREIVGRRQDGTAFPMDVTVGSMTLGQERLSVMSVRDVTERKRAEQLLEHQALHDGLTDLPNRTLLHDRLQHALITARRTKTPVALIVMDLDRFKEVNDTFGHHYGDLLLREVAGRLEAGLRRSDTVARMGGDEFAMVLPGADLDSVVQTAHRLIAALESPFFIEGQPLMVGASIGIALCPDHGTDAFTLLRRADVAMYVAKRSNSGHTVYAFEQDEHSPDRLALVAELRTAIETDQLVLHYQPKVEYHSSRISWVEALVRWVHPTRGELRPDEFISVAEQTGLIRPLSQWVLNAALRQCRQWLDAGIRLPVAVNLSMRNLHDADLPDLIRGLLQAHAVPPALLKVEVTESSLMADPARAMHTLECLRAMGLEVAIDDFGTGYSSLSYLKRLPVSEIKIDRSFVRHMVTDRNDAAIVRSTIALSHELGLNVVAEGVEDRETWELLADLGCDLAQGYYITRPLSAPDLAAWLAHANPAGTIPMAPVDPVAPVRHARPALGVVESAARPTPIQADADRLQLLSLAAN